MKNRQLVFLLLIGFVATLSWASQAFAREPVDPIHAQSATARQISTRYAKGWGTARSATSNSAIHHSRQAVG